jgi:hypothetical protein
MLSDVRLNEVPGSGRVAEAGFEQNGGPAGAQTMEVHVSAQDVEDLPGRRVLLPVIPRSYGLVDGPGRGQEYDNAGGTSGNLEKSAAASSAGTLSAPRFSAFLHCALLQPG